MNVIFDASDDDRLTSKFGENATDVAMQFVAQRQIGKKGSAIFRRENGVDENFCQRLGHESEDARGGDGTQ